MNKLEQTKKYRSRIERLDKMIENKLCEITRLRSMATSVSVPIDKERVQTSGEPDRLGEAVAKIIDLERETDEIVDKFVDERKRLIEQIDSIDNTNYYQILTCRFVQCEKLKALPYKLDMSERRFYGLYNEALKEFERKYGHEYLNKNYMQ